MKQSVIRERLVRLAPGMGSAALAAVMMTVGASQAQAQQVVADAMPDPCDFVTSGGFVVNDNTKKVSFGAHGGCKNGELWGHVNVVDHETGYHINGDEITGYAAPFGLENPTRDVCGWASTNRATDPERMRFRVRLVDNGEPGSQDLFGIVLADDYAVTYTVAPRLLSDKKPGGGNVQLHAPNPSTAAPVPGTNPCNSLYFPGEGPGGGGGGGGSDE